MDVTLDLYDVKARPVRVALALHRDTVELRHQEHHAKIMDRDTLRRFMRHPSGHLTLDGVEWIQWEEQVWLRIGESIEQPLTEPQLADLQRQL